MLERTTSSTTFSRGPASQSSLSKPNGAGTDSCTSVIYIFCAANKARNRYPSEVQVLSGDGPTSWTEVAVASTATTIVFEEPVEARFMRIVVLSVHDGEAVADKPIAVAG